MYQGTALAVPKSRGTNQCATDTGTKWKRKERAAREFLSRYG